MKNKLILISNIGFQTTFVLDLIFFMNQKIVSIIVHNIICTALTDIYIYKLLSLFQASQNTENNLNLKKAKELLHCGVLTLKLCLNIYNNC